MLNEYNLFYFLSVLIGENKYKYIFLAFYSLKSLKL